MRSGSTWPLCLLMLLVAISDVALADNRICINADNVINQMYVDGVDVTSKLINRTIVRLCDCISLPAATKTIAVSASNLNYEAGIQACRSDNAAVFDGWRCRDSNKVKGTQWYSSSYNMKSWQPAKVNTFLKKRSCENWKELPCQTTKNEWFWAVEQIPSVVCRIDYCAPSCTGCQAAGVGRCDPDKCVYEAGTENGDVVRDAGNFVTCNQKCCIDVKATVRTTTPNGYIKVTNNGTGNVDIWAAKKAGRYLATIDMATCTVTRRNYADWTKAPDMTILLNKWKNSDLSPNLRNVIGVDLAVGNGTGSYAPWIDVWRLGVDATESLFGSKQSSTSFKACLTGADNKDVTFSNVVGPNYF